MNTVPYIVWRNRSVEWAEDDPDPVRRQIRIRSPLSWQMNRDFHIPDGVG